MGIPVAEQAPGIPMLGGSSSGMGHLEAAPPRPALNRAQTEQALHGLNAKGFPLGLCNALRGSLEAFPLRIWVVDNSGSMASADGARFVNKRKIRATRWAELGDTVIEMGELSTLLGVRTDFHFLNPPAGGSQYVSVGPDSAENLIPTATQVDLNGLRALMGKSPSGGTPLDATVNNICRALEPVAEKLLARGQKVVVVIATDGMPNSSPRFLEAMQRLQRLPVWVVCRLCTSEDSIVDYYSNLDKNLEAPLEVLDDICGEAAEIKKVNPFMAYGPQLHQLREWGLPEKLFDLLDEAPMIPSQAKTFIEFVLGCKPLPEPEVDPAAFLAAVNDALRGAPTTFDPLKLREVPWVDVGALQRQIRGGGGGCSVM